MELKTFFAQDTSGNVIPNPTAYVYLPNTTTLVAGLVDKNGGALTNPFTGPSTGLLQFAAPDGEYDLRVTGAGRDFTIRIQCLDASDVVADAEAARDDAVAAAAAAEATATAFAASLGTAATKDVGTDPGDVVEVQAGGKLPALDGSLLTSLPSGGASTSANNTWTAAQRGACEDLGSGTSFTPNFDTNPNKKITLNGSATLNNPSTTPVAGQSGYIWVYQDGTGNRSLALGSYYKLAYGVTSLSIATTASAWTRLGYVVQSASIIELSPDWRSA